MPYRDALLARTTLRIPEPAALMIENGRSAFGARAEQVAAAFAPSDPVVVFDHTRAGEALTECARRKFQGQSFLVRPVVVREYAVRTEAVMPAILTSFATMDEQRNALDQAFAGVLTVDGRPLASIAIYSSEALRLMQGAVRLSSGLAVSSNAERRRILDLLATDPAAKFYELNDPLAPTRDKRHCEGSRDAIVIWAPHLDGTAAHAFVLPLAELRYPILLVSGTPPSTNAYATWVPIEKAEAALSRAVVIVDTNGHGADASRNLSSWGAPLVADIESGANEFMESIRTYDRQRMRSIFEAVVASAGLEPPRMFSSFEKIFAIPDERLLRDGPRVSVIIGTYDRPVMVREAIESIQRQTYTNVETVVVVDGGPRLDALSERYPNVVFLHMEENNPVKSVNTAFAHTTGKYITMLNDDDLYFPDHVASLVTALERSGASIANADVLTVYLEGGDDNWQLRGLESNMSRAAEPGVFLVANQIGIMSCMFRRECIHENMLIDPAIPMLGDYSLWARLSAEHDFVHVERITGCYTIRNKGARQQSVTQADQLLEAYRTVYERFPARGRPLILRQREERLRAVERGEAALNAEPAAEVRPRQWPLW